MRLLSSLAFSFVSSAVFALAACGGAQPDAKVPETAGPAGSASAGATSPSGPAATKPWKEMALGEKKTHMKTVVMPKMTEAFQAFDKTKFADVTCVTCHGPGAKNGNFTMPSAALPKLNVEGGFKKHKDAKPEITKFMMEKVMPEMLSALPGAKPYDPATHQGFGCTGCHMLEK